MTEFNIENAQSNLINEALQSTPYRFPMIFLRKFLWLFIKPFHFNHLTEINILHNKLTTTANCIENSMAELISSCSMIKNEMAALSSRIEQQENHLNNLQNSLFKSDLIALTNRLTFLQSANDIVQQRCDQLEKIIQGMTPSTEKPVIGI